MKASLLLLLGIAGCGGEVAVAPPPKPAELVAPLPACPDAVAPSAEPLGSAGFEGKSVARVCLVGGTEASRKSVERVALLRAGETFTAARVRADLGALMKLGLFEDAAASGLAVPGGVVVVYVLRDRPRIADIAFQGVKAIDGAALAAKLPIAKGSPYDPAAVTVVAHALRDEYHDVGYGACRTVVVAEPVATPAGAPAEVRVRIKVDEGVQWHLARIDVRGNKKVPEADIRKAAGLKVGQPAVQDQIERAVLVISSLFFDRGFIAMRADAEQGAADAAGNVPLAFVIDEGDVHTIRALHVTQLGAAFEKEILEKVVRARPKQVFSRTSLIEDITRVKEFFAKRGQTVEILPQTDVDMAKHTVDLTFVVEAP